MRNWQRRGVSLFLRHSARTLRGVSATPSSLHSVHFCRQMWPSVAFCFFALINGVRAASTLPTQHRLVHDILETYDKKAKPTWENQKPINVTFSMDLYQILELNEPQQYILLNAWIIERWNDEFLYWHPEDYDNITEIRLPYYSIWLPDTTLYNSLVMKDDDTRRLLNAKLTTNTTRHAALIELLYPTIYKFSCLLNLEFFPFDTQTCTMTFSSWTYDQKGIDYFPFSGNVGTSNYIENEGWDILKTTVRREEVRYSCCPNKYTLLLITLYLRRKPLFYLVNLIIPTSIITLIAIVGFFTSSSASGMREEKVSLGITTLLSMSILMLMVSDQMPTTSTFIPLIGWFILAMIFVISIGTVASSVVIAIQKRGRLGERLSRRAVRITKLLSFIALIDAPEHIRKESAGASDIREEYKRAVKISNKHSHAGSHRPSWCTLTRAFSTPRPAGHGVSIVSDKSTDLLVPPSLASGGLPEASHRALSRSATQRSLPSFSERAGALPSLPPLPYPPPLLTSPPPVAPLTSLLDDDDSDNGDSTRAPTTHRDSSTHANIISQLGDFAENVRESRKQAVEEYEWLASVVERCCFMLFVIGFLVLSIGINMLGYVHWHYALHFANKIN